MEVKYKKFKYKLIIIVSLLFLLLVYFVKNNPAGYNLYENNSTNSSHLRKIKEHSVKFIKFEAGSKSIDAVAHRKTANGSKPVQIGGGVLNYDIHGRKSFYERTSSTAKVVYNVEDLIKAAEKIHDNLYIKPKNETCEIRPAGCVIIGVAKSGTQELLNFLSIHPNVIQKHNLPNPNLFDIDAHLVKSKEKMPCTFSDQIGIVKTDYFFFRDNMPAKFYKYNSKLKMILLVREPIERLISAYSFTYLQKKQHKLVFNYRLQDVPEIDSVFVDQRNQSVKVNQFDLAHSVYDKAMERYLKYFSRDQILVIESSDFKKNPVAVLQTVEKFLDLKPVITEDYFAYNKQKHFHCLKTAQGMTCYGSDRGRAKLKDIKPETRHKLQEYFKPHNERFFDLIGKRFNWSKG